MYVNIGVEVIFNTALSWYILKPIYYVKVLN